jgi:hypothetical protein
MKIGIIYLALFGMFISCNHTQDPLKEQILSYVKSKVRNPKSVELIKYQVFDKADQNSLFNIESKSNKISEKSEYVNVLFSGKNTEGNEIYREVTLYMDKNTKQFNKSFPENIDVENGYLSGSCKYVIANPITNWGVQNFCNNARVTIMNVDSLGGKKVYFTQVGNGTYEINKIVPGNYFIKIIHYGINLESIYGTQGKKKNNFLVLEIEKIMGFYEIYSDYLNYGFSDEILFRSNYAKLKSYLSELNSTTFTDYEVDVIWEEFKKSVNRQFLKDFDVDKDYKYLNKYEMISIESSPPTRHDFNINNFFY